MNLRQTLLLCLAGLTPVAPLCAESDAEVQAHEMALDLAGAFSNEGFKSRDGHWAGTVKPAEKVLIAVNLYAGNQYWFTAGATENVKKISVDVFDESGRQVPTESYNSENKAAAGYSPTISGQYFVSLGLQDSDPATVCLVYSYK